MKKLIFMLMACLIISVQPCYAAPEVFMVESHWELGSGDSESSAHDKARLEAQKMAVAQAGVYIEKYTQVKNMVLTQQEVETVSAAIIKMKEISKFFDKASGIYYLKCEVTADMDGINIQEILALHRNKGKKEIRRSEVKYYPRDYLDYLDKDFDFVKYIVFDLEKFTDHNHQPIVMPKARIIDTDGNVVVEAVSQSDYLGSAVKSVSHDVLNKHFIEEQGFEEGYLYDTVFITPEDVTARSAGRSNYLPSKLCPDVVVTKKLAATIIQCIKNNGWEYDDRKVAFALPQ